MDKLDGPRLAPQASGPARHLIVLLHGLGADGSDLIGLAPHWASALPHAAFAAPDAPFPCDLAPYGRQWFSVQDRTPSVIEAGVRAAAAPLNAFLERELTRLALPPEALALVGFSQGCMMALFAGLRLSRGPAAIIGFSGALIAADQLATEALARPPVLLVHGEADEVVPVERSRVAESALRAAGLAVTALYRPGLGHGIDEAGLDAGLATLRAGFGMTAV